MGDFLWRYFQPKKKPLANLFVVGFGSLNFVQCETKPNQAVKKINQINVHSESGSANRLITEV